MVLWRSLAVYWFQKSMSSVFFEKYILQLNETYGSSWVFKIIKHKSGYAGVRKFGSVLPKFCNRIRTVRNWHACKYGVQFTGTGGHFNQAFWGIKNLKSSYLCIHVISSIDEQISEFIISTPTFSLIVFFKHRSHLCAI